MYGFYVSVIDNPSDIKNTATIIPNNPKAKIPNYFAL